MTLNSQPVEHQDPVLGSIGGRRPGAGRPKGSKSPPRGETETYSSARARKEVALADLREMEVAQQRGDLLPAAEVAAAWTEQIAVAKARLMALPARLAPELINARDLRAIEAAIRDAIIGVLEELSGSPGP